MKPEIFYCFSFKCSLYLNEWITVVWSVARRRSFTHTVDHFHYIQCEGGKSSKVMDSHRLENLFFFSLTHDETTLRLQVIRPMKLLRCVSFKY